MTQKEKAAAQNATAPNQQEDLITQKPKDATKLERVVCHLVENGPHGISSLSARVGLPDLNPRSSGELAHLKRYWVADRGEARKLVRLINLKRHQPGAALLSQEQTLLALPLPPRSSATSQPHKG